MKSSTKKWWIIGGIALGIVCCIVIGFYALLEFAAKVEDEFVPYRTTDIKEYQNWTHVESEKGDVDSGLFIFPENVSSAVETDYAYTYQRGLLENGYDMYLKASYEEEEYAKEVQRLSEINVDIKLTDGSIVNKAIMYSDSLFAYPAYVAIYNAHNSFEYALLDEENQTIVYVYHHLLNDEEAGNTPQEYRPLEFQEKSMEGTSSWENFHLYYEKDENSGSYLYYTEDRAVL